MLFMLFNSTYYKINRRLINLILVASCESYVMFNTRFNLFVRRKVNVIKRNKLKRNKLHLI